MTKPVRLVEISRVMATLIRECLKYFYFHQNLAKMASGRPLNILSSLDEAEEWHKQSYICGLPKKFKPFKLDSPPLYLRSWSDSSPPWTRAAFGSIFASKHSSVRSKCDEIIQHTFLGEWGKGASGSLTRTGRDLAKL